MVAQVHEAEGGTHVEGPVTIDLARGYLRGLGAFEENLHYERFTNVAVFRKARYDAPGPFADLDREELIRALGVFAKNWLAHDGSWFLATEKRHGIDIAIELDAASWQLFAAAEARRIMDAFSIPQGGGLAAPRGIAVGSFGSRRRNEIPSDVRSHKKGATRLPLVWVAMCD